MAGALAGLNFLMWRGRPRPRILRITTTFTSAHAAASEEPFSIRQFRSSAVRQYTVSMYRGLLIAIWLCACTWATLPAFWLVAHPFAARLRRRRKPYLIPLAVWG